jgi:hypothetical protein
MAMATHDDVRAEYPTDICHEQHKTYSAACKGQREQRAFKLKHVNKIILPITAVA